MAAIDGASAPPHVVVVGGGLAGLAASLEAAGRGARVTLLDKCPSLGGNSAKATSGINGAESHHQREQGIEDSVALFGDDTLRSGKGKSDPALVEILASRSAGALAWLEAQATAAGAGLDLSSITHLGGHSHRIPPTPDGQPVPVGWTIVSALRKAVEAQAGRIEVRTGTTATELVTRDEPSSSGGGGRVVVGVRCRRTTTEEGQQQGQSKAVEACNASGGEGGDPSSYFLPADAVVLTAGGYAFDDGTHPESSLLQEFAPRLAGAFPTTNGAQATGDGVRLGRAVGAALIDMDQVQIHPTGMVDPKDPSNRVKMLAPEALRGCGGILVEPTHGRRFVDELTTRDAATAAILEHCDNNRGNNKSTGAGGGGTHAVLLLNDAAADKFGRPTLGFYQGRGLVQEFPSADAAATGLGMAGSEGLVASLREYSESARVGRDAFGKTVFPVKEWDPSQRLYAILVTPSLHYCMGGLRIDERARVLREGLGGGVIGGLLAAGEVTGGVHGGNRLGGNSLLECVVFGRIAGREAVAGATATATAAGADAGASAAKT